MRDGHLPDETTATVRAPAAGPVVCIHEDRTGNLPGVQLAVLSLARHAPALRVHVHAPGAGGDFVRWVATQPNAEMVVLSRVQGGGWNIKASVLLEMLERFAEVVWIDSDIVVSADIERFFANLSPATLLATEETYWGQQQGGDFRTSAWGLEPARTLSCTVNSGVLRVTRLHRKLLEDWQSMLSHPLYLRAQSRPWYERPIHMVGDQEVLTGLLCSSSFADMPLKLLRRGTDIAQCFGPAGFTPMERLRALTGRRPAFIHAMGPKPWLRRARSARTTREKGQHALRDWYTYVSLDVSPYCIEARSYAGTPGLDVGWAYPRSPVGKLLSTLGGPRVAGPGFPLAVFDHGARWLKRRLRVGRYADDPEFVVKERPF